MTRGTVLLVEDDPVVGRLLMLILQNWGFEAKHVSTSREAADFVALPQNAIALVVCDVNLQGESGAAVVAKIRAIRPRTKALYTSGSPFDILCEAGLLTRESLQNRDTGYIKKPFLPENLKDAIDSLLSTTERPWDTRQTGVQYASGSY